MNLGKIEWITFDVDGNPVLINVALEFMIIHSKMRCTNMCLRAFVHVFMAHNGQYITGTKWMKSICPATAQLDSKLEIVIWHCSQIHIIVGNSNHIYQNKYNVILRSKHKTKCIMFEICASVYLSTPLPLQCILLAFRHSTLIGPLVHYICIGFITKCLYPSIFLLDSNSKLHSFHGGFAHTLAHIQTLTHGPYTTRFVQKLKPLQFSVCTSNDNATQ